MVIYTDPQSLIQSIEYNKENHPILKQIHKIKKITLCKVPAEMGIKAAKEAINMTEVTATRLPYTDYYLDIGRVRDSKW